MKGKNMIFCMYFVHIDLRVFKFFFPFIKMIFHFHLTIDCFDISVPVKNLLLLWFFFLLKHIRKYYFYLFILKDDKIKNEINIIF